MSFCKRLPHGHVSPVPLAPASRPTPDYTEPAHSPNHGQEPSVIMEDDDPKPVRLKARPKRSTSFGTDNPPQSNFSQAG